MNIFIYTYTYHVLSEWSEKRVPITYIYHHLEIDFVYIYFGD